MSVTFCLAKKVVGKVGYQFLYPSDFDPTPVIDPEYPEYGAIPPDNPYTLNVHNDNAKEILRTFNITGELHNGGILDNLDEVIEICNQVIASVRTIPELDLGTPSVMSKFENGPLVVECGHLPGWYGDRFGKLLELATIAKQKEAVITYA